MKTANKILLGLTLTGAMLCSGDLSAEKTVKDSKKTLIELFDNTNLEQISHEQIVKSKISDLVAKFGLEKTKELVREHALIEINKYKQGEKYKSNNILNKSAQNHADDMSENNYFKHVNLKGQNVRNRVEETGGYNYQTLSENRSFRDNIFDVIYGYTLGQSTGHNEIFGEDYKDMGIGISKVKDPKREGRDLYYFVFNFGKEYNSNI